METTVGVRSAAGGAGAARSRFGRSLVGAIVAAAMLLAALPTAASAAAPEMRGEWSISIATSSHTSHATAIISTEANGNGEFAASSLEWEGIIRGTFTGKLEGSTASVVLTGEAYGPYPSTEFTSNSMSVQSSGSSLSLSGSGTATAGGQSTTATVTATRVRTYKEIEEQREREQREREEAEAREDVRGEWAIVIESGPQVVHAVARVTGAANAQNEFSSSSALFEGAIPGTFSGTLALEAGKSSVKMTSQAAGPYPASTFTSSAATVTSTATSMSMSGSGTIEVSGASAPATFTATRTKDYGELAELEAKEKAEAEAKATQAREAKEKQETIEREAKEKLAKEEAAKQSGTPASQTFAGTGNLAQTFSVEPLSKVLTVSAAGTLALPLSNLNGFAVTGRVTLVLVSSTHTGKASRSGKTHKIRHAKRAPLVLGTASFTIAADGHATVKIALSKAGRAELARRKTLPAAAKVLTEASGRPSVSKTYELTLHAAKPAGHHSKH